MIVIKQIYLAGKMGGLTYEEYTGWRKDCRKLITSNFFSEGTYDVHVLDPSIVYNFENPTHKTEKEIMRYELREVKKSAVVLVNLDGIDTSTGTIMEVLHAFENDVPVIGVGNTDIVHPWIVECLDRVEETFKEAIDYIWKYYM